MSEEPDHHAHLAFLNNRKPWKRQHVVRVVNKATTKGAEPPSSSWVEYFELYDTRKNWMKDRMSRVLNNLVRF